LIEHPRPSTIRIKRKGERGSLCLIPQDGEKVGNGESLIKMEKKVEVVKDMIHLIQEEDKSKVERML